MNRIRLLTLVFLVFYPAFRPALAEVEREAFLIGFDVGASDLQDRNLMGTGDDRNIGFNVAFYAGYSFTQQFSLAGLIDAHSGFGEVGKMDYFLSNVFAGPMVQYSIDRFNFRLAPGLVATAAEIETNHVTESADRNGVGIYFSPSVDLFEHGHFAIDLKLKVIPQWYWEDDDSGFAYMTGAAVGFTWY